VIPLSRLVCTVQEARRVSFADLGVPEGSRAVDLALGRDVVWVLFSPALLVAVPRGGEPGEAARVAEWGAIEDVEMIPGPKPDAWTSVAVDPRDGTLWLASPGGLWRRRPGRRPEPVPVAGAKPAGAKGGFRGVVVGRSAVWAAPACAPDAVWKLDSKGKMLATALPQPEAPGGCAEAVLERDWSGDVWAFRSTTGEAFRLAFDGSWKPAGETLTVPAPGESAPIHSWFFWGTEPLALGDSPDGPLLYRRVDGRVTAFREDCGEGNALVGVEGDSRGWAALTGAWLLLGEHERH
jgi:hypothetical protein